MPRHAAAAEPCGSSPLSTHARSCCARAAALCCLCALDIHTTASPSCPTASPSSPRRPPPPRALRPHTRSQLRPPRNSAQQGQSGSRQGAGQSRGTSGRASSSPAPPPGCRSQILSLVRLTPCFPPAATRSRSRALRCSRSCRRERSATVCTRCVSLFVHAGPVEQRMLLRGPPLTSSYAARRRTRIRASSRSVSPRWQARKRASSASPAPSCVPLPPHSSSDDLALNPDIPRPLLARSRTSSPSARTSRSPRPPTSSPTRARTSTSPRPAASRSTRRRPSTASFARPGTT